MFEPVGAPWKLDGIPRDFSFGDARRPTGTGWRRSSRSRCAASRSRSRTRHPHVLLRAGELHPRPVADGRRGARAANYFVAAGLNSIGILTGGGLGRVLAHWIIDGHPDVDVTGVTSTGCTRTRRTPSTARTRTVESLGMVYHCHYPNAVDAAPRAARSARRSTTGWRPRARTSATSAAGRAPDWFARPGVDADAEHALPGAGRAGSTALGGRAPRGPRGGVI